MIIDGFTLMLIVMGLVLLIPIANFGSLWISQWIYVLQMKEVNERHRLSTMGLWETASLKRKRLSQ